MEQQLGISAKGKALGYTSEQILTLASILEYEASHGKCTQTFMKKLRRQLRPPA